MMSDDNKEYLSLLNDTIKKHFDNTNILCLSKYDEDIEKKDFFFIDIDLNNENGIDVAKKSSVNIHQLNLFL